MHNLKELSISNKAIMLTIEVYEAVSDFPKEEKYGLAFQNNRSAISIPANKLNLMSKETSDSILNKTDEIQKITYGLIKKLKNN